MKKSLIAGIAVASVVGLGSLIVLPLVIGSKTKARFETEGGHLGSPYTHLRMVSYDRGLYRSIAHTEIVIQRGAKSLTIPLQHTILHAPLAGISAVSMTTELNLDKEAKAELAQLLGDKAPLVFKTKVGFKGHSHTDFSAPAFATEKEGEKWVSQGLSGTLDVEGPHVTLMGTFPKFDSRKPDSDFTLADLTFNGDMTKAADENWFGTVDVSLGNLSANEHGSRMLLEDVRFNERITEQGTDMLNAVLTLSSKKIAFKDHVLNDAKFDVEVKNLDRTALQSYSKDMEAVSPGSDPELVGIALMGSMMKNGPLLLKRSPQLLQQLHFTSPEGTFNGKIDVTFNGAGDFQLQAPEMMMRTRVNARMDSSKPVLAGFLNPGEIKALIKTGKLVEEGETYSTTAVFEHGRFTLNGKEIDLLKAMFSKPGS